MWNVSASINIHICIIRKIMVIDTNKKIMTSEISISVVHNDEILIGASVWESREYLAFMTVQSFLL